jgi:ABC transport system ATP-binding/permease protein
VQIAYYDQQREQLDPDRTVVDTLGDGNDTVFVNGQPRHVLGYLQDFLFSPERAHRRSRALSGGERNRLLLARLLTRPANVLILDEPTNDLDLETLELLEQQLIEWDGTLLLVSHDRRFLDNVVTSTLALEGNGVVREYVGGYADYLRQRTPTGTANPTSASNSTGTANVTGTSSLSGGSRKQPAKKKRTFKEEREYTELPERIAALEKEQERVKAQLADTEFYRKPGSEIKAAVDRVEEIDRELLEAMSRWDELDSIGR